MKEMLQNLFHSILCLNYILCTLYSSSKNYFQKTLVFLCDSKIFDSLSQLFRHVDKIFTNSLVVKSFQLLCITLYFLTVKTDDISKS